MDHFTLVLISLVANTFSAFVGGGAGLFQLPVLIFMGLPFGVALATHKLASVALGVGATIRHLKGSSLHWRPAVLLLVTGIPGVIAGAAVVVHVPDVLATSALGILTISLGLYSWFTPSLGQDGTPKNRDLSGAVIGGVVLFLIGVLNGSLASGSGLFVTLWLVAWYGLDFKRAVTYTLILVGFFWNGSGAIALGILSEIYWQWLPALLVGSVLGGYLGAHLSLLHGNRWIKRGYELTTVLVGLKLLIG